MDEQITKDRPKSRVKKRSNPFGYLAILLIAILIAVFYFFTQRHPTTSFTERGASSTTVEKQQITDQKNPQSAGTEEGNKSFGQTAAEPERESTPQNLNSSEGDQPTSPVNPFGQNEGMRTDTETATDASSIIKQRYSGGGNPQLLVDELNSFYAHLDQQPYVQNFGLNKPIKAYFSGLIQKLVEHPPVIYRETDNLFTVLQNTAHFFRVLGKDNIIILKEILNKEHNSFERVLKAFYGLTYQPEYLKKEYGLSIPPAIRTDYAAFFLNTMGGRLYLFRRDPLSRMVVSYYAIITIDRANSEGNGGHGIDLRPAIRSLIEEIENGGGRLQLKDEYLDVLYDLQEKYN